ncbi:hypothetical protein EDC65_4656 [Stella humosa]|uniref:Asp/Glu/hydantoin racemase n=1 Tax=Stella humosa TaxID=94 RepID=A0A3N1L0T8_9PROT|nr:hypothetical protein [Stella humosa]ROP83125.1 hypothetical protein EDC65_4656 [Stella humosa]BBK30098.1 hypothetical protein STHU_07320 [Stella humosa]
MMARPAALGILQLANTPMMLVGCPGNPATFDFPVRYRQVSGAWVDNVVAGDPAVEAAFVAAARALEQEGVAALTTACGFALRHQRAIAAVLRIPVATSSLLLLPSMLAAARPGGRIGVLTFDARHFSPDLLPLAGVAAPDRVAVMGIEGSESWERMSQPEVQITADILERDVLAAIDRLVAREANLAGLLFECGGFGPVSAAARRRTGLPVLDAIDNARLLMAGVG